MAYKIPYQELTREQYELFVAYRHDGELMPADTVVAGSSTIRIFAVPGLADMLVMEESDDDIGGSVTYGVPLNTTARAVAEDEQ